MDADDWYRWCTDITVRVQNVEKSLLTYDNLQKRMLYVMITGFLVVLGYGVLL